MPGNGAPLDLLILASLKSLFFEKATENLIQSSHVL